MTFLPYTAVSFDFFLHEIIHPLSCKFLNNFNWPCYSEQQKNNNIAKGNNGGLTKKKQDRKFFKDRNHRITTIIIPVRPN